MLKIVIAFFILFATAMPATANDSDIVRKMLATGQCHYKQFPGWTRRDISGGITNVSEREKIKRDYEIACEAELDEVERRVQAGECPRIEGFFSSDVLDRGLTAQQSDAESTPESLRRFQEYDKARSTCPRR
ncbi:MAG: hypothetical protein NT019_02765 [Candidatus Adlerbacteria bacterium]|nr:hypothetical protein [Candidatus Adlerbacteria bacterium]